MARPDTAAASGTVASSRICPGGQRVPKIGQVLGLCAEGHAQGHHRVSARGLGVLGALHVRVRNALAQAVGGLGRGLRAPRPDHHRRPGRREPERQPEPERAGAADDRDRVGCGGVHDARA